jgi:uncharacterized damage-inducible protein DinB
MQTTYLQRLFEYDRAANNRTIDAIDQFPSDKQEMQKLLSHVLNALYIWIDRIEGKAPTYTVWEIHAAPAMKAINEHIHQRISSILADRTDLDQPVIYHNSQGDQFENEVFDILFHLVNHGTHHRGQIVRMLREGGVAPPRLDYIFFKRTN